MGSDRTVILLPTKKFKCKTERERAVPFLCKKSTEREKSMKLCFFSVFINLYFLAILHWFWIQILLMLHFFKRNWFKNIQWKCNPIKLLHLVLTKRFVWILVRSTSLMMPGWLSWTLSQLLRIIQCGTVDFAQRRLMTRLKTPYNVIVI